VTTRGKAMAMAGPGQRSYLLGRGTAANEMVREGDGGAYYTQRVGRCSQLNTCCIKLRIRGQKWLLRQASDSERVISHRQSDDQALEDGDVLGADRADRRRPHETGRSCAGLLLSRKARDHVILCLRIAIRGRLSYEQNLPI
jgi:hypothetical protein